MGVHSTKASNQTQQPEGYDVFLGNQNVRQFLQETLPEDVLNGANTGSQSLPRDNGQDSLNPSDPTDNQPSEPPRSTQPQNNFVLDTALARDSYGQLMMYIYATQPVRDVAILAGDGRWYSATVNCTPQPGWSVIQAVAVSEGWLQQSSVQVRGTINGTSFTKNISLLDKR